LIGGDYQGVDPTGLGTLSNAQFTFVDKYSSINVDAMTRGNGGKVIIWSDGDTDFRGNITARGGLEIGDGGFVEVSGKKNLNFVGQVDVNATNGKQGSILLDPEDIIINPDDDDDSTFDVSDLQKLRGNVTLTATNSIVFNTNTYFINSGGTITLQAPTVNLLGTFGTGGRNLNVSGASIYGMGHINSSSYAGQSGYIKLTSSGGINLGKYAISTNSVQGSGGNITLKANTFITTGLVDTGANGNGNGGNVNLSATAGIFTSTIVTHSTGSGKSGNILLQSTLGSINTTNSSFDTDDRLIYAAGNGGSAGSVTLTAYSDIVTNSIRASSNGGAGNTIKLTSLMGKIDTNGGEISTYSNNSNAGNVILNACDIAVGKINSSSYAGQSGYIKLTSSGGINLGKYAISTNSVQGSGGNITLKANTFITTGLVDTGANGNGNGGNVNLSATAGIFTSTIVTHSTGSGKSGNILLQSTLGSINTTNSSFDTDDRLIYAAGNGGSAGSVTLTAYSDIVTNSIRASSNGGAGNTIKLTSLMGKIDTNGGLISSTSLAGGNAGAITLNSAKDIKVGDIFARSRDGEVTTTGVWNGGRVTLDAGGNIESGNITTTSITGNAGIVTLKAGGDIEAGAIASNTFAGSGKGGNITLDGKNITAESLRADSVGADGGQIKLTADKFIQITGSTSVNGKDYSIFTDSKDVDPSPNDTGARSAPILIRHSQKVRDESLTPFIVGDSSKNGTATSISDGIVDFGVSSGNTREVYDFNFNFNDIYIKRPFALLADISNILGIPGVPILKKESNIIDNILKFLPYIPALATSDIQSISNSVVSLLSRISKQELLNLGLGIQKVDLDKYYSLLITAMAISGINSVDNQAHFLTQLIHESDRFISTSEKYNGNDYTYFENKYGYLTEAGMDLGNTKLGDGSNFRGRGLIQITGRDAYKQFGEYLGFGDLFINAPKLVSSDPIFAVLSSIWFWTSDYKNGVIRINTNNQFSSFREIAEANNIPNNDPLDLNGDKSDRVEGITLSLNGGYNGLEDRKLIFNKIRNASVG
jgi:predicted chitinase